MVPNITNFGRNLVFPTNFKLYLESFMNLHLVANFPRIWFFPKVTLTWHVWLCSWTAVNIRNDVAFKGVDDVVLCVTWVLKSLPNFANFPNRVKFTALHKFVEDTKFWSKFLIWRTNNPLKYCLNPNLG